MCACLLTRLLWKKTKYWKCSVDNKMYVDKVSIYRNIATCPRRNVGCLSLSGFDEISEVVFEDGASLTKKAEQERKRLQNVHAPMLRVLSCVTKWRERESCLWKSKCKRVCAVSVSRNGESKSVLSLEVKMWKRMSSWKTRVYIGNPCHAVGSKCAGQNQICGRSCEHKSRDFPGQ